MEQRRFAEPILVACPDARPPAYQAVVGLHRAKLLRSFVTSTYYNRDGHLATLLRRLAPLAFGRLEGVLLRRYQPEIPPALVCTVPSFDVALRIEARTAPGHPKITRALARWRTNEFDRRLARVVRRSRPGAVLLFSDVGSEVTLPSCRRLGIPTIVSMVHGDVRDEERVLETESSIAPEYMGMYLGGASFDSKLLAWLHKRRLRDLALADRIVVPSDYIAHRLMQLGTPSERVRVIPYAADCRRFGPSTERRDDNTCTFLFAGGISQRKGIKYLLEAWQRVRRPGWRLQLLGPLPRNFGPLAAHLETVEPLGRVSHSEMPARMRQADVFVFPSLFEGSAVVTYEALASGLPCVVTAEAGSVVRDGIEGFVVGARDVALLAARMEALGRDRDLRTRMAGAARVRALAFDWPRYHRAVVAVVYDLIGSEIEFACAQPVGRHGRVLTPATELSHS
jgi:starch synthase